MACSCDDVNVDIYDFEGCCGMQIVAAFGVEGEYSDGLLSEVVNEYNNKGFIGVTIPSQKDAIKALTKQKFTKLRSFRNPGTGNMLTIWFKPPKVSRKNPARARTRS